MRSISPGAGTHNIYLRPGDTFTGYLDSDNWTVGSIITIREADFGGKSLAVDGKWTISGGEGSTPSGSGTAYGSHIVVGIAVNITIQNGQFISQDWFPNSKVFAVRLNRVVNYAIIDCIFDGMLGTTIDSETHYYNGALIVAYATAPGSITGNFIQYWGPPCLWATPEIPAGATDYESIDASGIALVGIKTAGASVTISGNIVYNVNGDSVVEENVTVPVTITNNIFKNFGENAIDLKGGQNNHIYANWMYRDPAFVGMGGYPIASNPRNNGVVQFLYKAPDFAQNNLVEENLIGPTDTSAFAYKDNVSNNTVRNNEIIDAKTGVYFCCSSEASTGSGVGNASYNNRYIGSTGNFVYSLGYRGEITFENETFYSDDAMGVGLYLTWFDGTFRNSIFRMNDADSEMMNLDANSAPTFEYNIWRNEYAGDQNVVVWAGHTTRDEAAQAGWNGESIADNEIFGDPGIDSSGYATEVGSAVVNSGKAPTFAVQGLRNTSVWTYGAVSVVKIGRADNGGADRGAGEFPEDEPPPPVGGADVPVGTYAFAYNADYTDDTDEAWTADGATHTSGTVAAGVEIAGAYGTAGNGVRFSVANEFIKWTISVTPDELTVWGKITPESLNSGNSTIWHLWQDGSNQIYAYYRSTGVITLRYEGQGNVVSMNSTHTISAGTEVTLGFRISSTTHCNEDATGCLSIKVGANDWENDANAVAVTAFAAGTRYFYLGESDQTTVGLTNPWHGDEWSIIDSYNAAEPDWTPADVTAPTMDARGVCSDASCTACTEDLTTSYVLGDSFRVCGELSEDSIVTESPTWAFTCGTVTIYLDYFEKKDIGGIKYLTARATVSAKSRCSNPVLAEMVGGEIKDGSGNELDRAGTAGIFTTGTITIGGKGEWSVGTFVDYDGDEYQGEYPNFTTLRASITKVDGDQYGLGIVTEPGALNLGNDDCTEADPCIITGIGETWTGDITFGDWWVISKIKHASDIVLGSNNTHQLSIIPEGSTLTIPSGATGCNIYRDLIKGTLIVNESATFKGIAVPGSVTLANGKTFTGEKCSFSQSEATIEASGGTVTCSDCRFEVADMGFIDEDNEDFRLIPTSVLRNAGVAITGIDYDIIGTTLPQEGTNDIGPYEFAVGTVVWGAETDIIEDISRSFTDNWSGTGTVIGSGDSEKLRLYPNQYMEMNYCWNINASGYMTIFNNKYSSASSGFTIKYKTGATSEDCESDEWNVYNGSSFNCLGWVKLRVEY